MQNPSAPILSPGPSHISPHPLAATHASPHDSSELAWHMLAVGALTLFWYSLVLAQLALTSSAAQNVSGLAQASLVGCLLAGSAGGALLLMQSRFAVQAMVAALVALLVLSAELFVFAQGPVDLYAKPMVLGLWVITQASAFYALRIRSQGLLR